MKGRRYSTEDGSLTLTGVTDTSGQDAVGPWTGIRHEYSAGGTPVWTTIRAYETVPAVVFGQVRQ